jgi:uncharacterized protein (TIGR03435 family)
MQRAAKYVVGLTAFLSTPLLAQEPAATLRYEVASIKPHPKTGQDRMDGTNFPNGRMTATFLSLADLVRSAYDVSSEQLSGGPSWIYTERFDVNASAPADRTYSEQDFRFMLQALLLERFALKLHRETRDVPAFALTVSRNGSRLKESAAEEKSAATVRPGLIQFSKVSLGALTATLPQFLGRPVVDRTGLPEKYYTFALEWGADATFTGPSIFTALEEQLGLKLDAIRAPQEFIIIHEASPPTAN